MYWCVAIAIVLVNYTVAAPSPLRLTIDCSDERGLQAKGLQFRSLQYNRNHGLDVDSFCDLIHNAIPKAVQDGKFVPINEDFDQIGFSDTQIPMSIAPPKGFIPSLAVPKLKGPRLKIPKINVPKLREQNEGLFQPPKIGAPMSISTIMRPREDSSAERMEKFKKGVQKMLHFVKVLGQIDQYLSDRTRIIVDKLTKTFAE